jgi:hypothetical protein
MSSLLCPPPLITLPRPMKAERRHELKTNALARNLEQAPEFFQKYGSQLLLGLVLCLLAFILVRNHYADKTRRAAEVRDNLGTALYSLDQLRTMSPFANPEKLAQDRRALAEETEKAVAVVLDKTDDPKIRATALLTRGDLNWQMANAPILPTTRPESKDSRSGDDYLNSAESAYDEVVRPPQDENRAAVVSARFGLAAIAENRRQWDKASQFYQQIIDDSSVGKEFTELAKTRQDSLKLLEKPIVLGTPIAREPRVKPHLPVTPEKLGPALPALPATTQPTISIPSTTQPSVTPGLASTTRPGSTTKPAP